MTVYDGLKYAHSFRTLLQDLGTVAYNITSTSLNPNAKIPESITRLRRFAVGILKSFQKPAQSIAEMMRSLCLRTRLVFDYLRKTKNSATTSRGL